MKTLHSHDTVVTLALSCIDESYGRYRLIRPNAEKAMADSINRYGQLTPVIVGRAMDNRYPLVDGFKRLRACRQLGHCQLAAKVLDIGQRALKAAMIHLNRKARCLTDMEEAMIVQSLYREDALSQVEIGVLLGCHKSWVCRRLSMIEGLAPEVVEQLRLGLVGIGISRELLGLPRGNQANVLDAVLKHRLTCRQTAQLVSLLKQRPKWEHDAILRFPESSLSASQSHRPPSKAGLPSICEELSQIKKKCFALLSRLKKENPSSVLTAQRGHALHLIDDIGQSLTALKMSPQLTEDADGNL